MKLTIFVALISIQANYTYADIASSQVTQQQIDALIQKLQEPKPAVVPAVAPKTDEDKKAALDKGAEEKKMAHLLKNTSTTLTILKNKKKQIQKATTKIYTSTH